MAMMVHLPPEETCALRGIVPADTSARYYWHGLYVESRHQPEVRARACVEAGALANGCAHEVTRVGPVYPPLIPDQWLAAAYRGAITGFGWSPLTPEVERNVHAGRTDMGNMTQAMPVIRPTSRRAPAAGGDS